MPREPSSDSVHPFVSRRPEFLRDLGLRFETRLSSRWTSIESGRVHSRSADRPGTVPFILIHGLVISSLYMIPLAECLAVEHEVHAIDLPGFGRSDRPRHVLSVPELAEAVVQWLRACGIQQCHFVANSMGCQIAARVAVKAPELVQTLVFIGATIDPSAHSLRKQFFRLLKDAPREPAQLWMNWCFDFARAGILRALRTTHQMFEDRIEPSLAMIQAPSLVLRGERDPTMPRAWGERAAACLPRGTLHVIPHHGHCVHYTAPLQTAEAILQHCGAKS
jgi:pimeloyl-ACP methyl ester carboxylesterase